MSNDSDNGRASASLDDAIQFLAGGEPLSTGGLAVTETWVSVEDRLPGEGQEVLCYVQGNDTMYMAQGCVKGGDYWEDVDERSITVTHWTPLPEPPRGS